MLNYDITNFADFLENMTVFGKFEILGFGTLGCNRFCNYDQIYFPSFYITSIDALIDKLKELGNEITNTFLFYPTIAATFALKIVNYI